jgi:tetratricopeptide (TPR) repeat protein
MTEDKGKLKRNWAEQAVSLALHGRWEEAIAINENIVSLFPDDTDAHNRLGKAYTEIGRYVEARLAYNRTLSIDEFNSIARKNLQRLASLASTAVVAPVAPAATPESPVAPQIVPQLFIATTGKTGTTTLINVADQETLARVTAGTPVVLEVQGSTLIVKSQRGVRLGEVEPKLGQRLIHFTQAGNRYAAAITSLDTHTVRVILRETHQHPSQVGRVSFPPKRGADSDFRAYTKEALVKYDEEEEERAPEEGEFGGEGEPLEEAPEEQDPFDDNDPDEE